MALINTADNIKVGSTQVDKIYLGSNLVWYPYWENFQTTSRLTSVNGSVIANWDRIADGANTVLNYNTAVNTHSCVWDNANSYSASATFYLEGMVRADVGGADPNPNQAQLVFGKQTGANFNQYAAVIDSRNTTGSGAAFQLRLNNSTTPLATSTVPVIAANTWYKISIDWRTSGTRITARLYNSTNVLLATLTSSDTTYTSGRVGCHGFNQSSFDNIRLIP